MTTNYDLEKSILSLVQAINRLVQLEVHRLRPNMVPQSTCPRCRFAVFQACPDCGYVNLERHEGPDKDTLLCVLCNATVRPVCPHCRTRLNTETTPAS